MAWLQRRWIPSHVSQRAAASNAEITIAICKGSKRIRHKPQPSNGICYRCLAVRAEYSSILVTDLPNKTDLSDCVQVRDTKRVFVCKNVEISTAKSKHQRCSLRHNARNPSREARNPGLSDRLADQWQDRSCPLREYSLKFILQALYDSKGDGNST